MGRLVNTVVMEVTTITQQVNKGALGGGAEGDTTLELYCEPFSAYCPRRASG